jgi:hypothetical protein
MFASRSMNFSLTNSADLHPVSCGELDKSSSPVLWPIDLASTNKDVKRELSVEVVSISKKNSVVSSTGEAMTCRLSSSRLMTAGSVDTAS